MYFLYSIYKVGSTLNGPWAYFTRFAQSYEKREDYTLCRADSVEELVKQVHECVDKLKVSRQYVNATFSLGDRLKRAYVHKDGGSIIYTKEFSPDEELVFLQLLTTPFKAPNPPE